MRKKKEFILSLVPFQLLAIFFSINLLAFQAYLPKFHPYGNETYLQAAKNSLVLLLPVILFTTFLIFSLIFKIRFILILLLIAFPIALLFLLSSLFIFSFLVKFLSFQTADLISFFLALSLAILAGFSFLKKYFVLTLLLTLLLATEVGVLLAYSFLPPTTYLIFLVFIVYDIVSVYKGPLKVLIRNLKKARKKPSHFGLLGVNLFGYFIGSGDVVFYSMLISTTLILKGIIPALFQIPLINFGIYLNLTLLEKFKKPLPGLPIPLSLGLPLLIF